MNLFSVKWWVQTFIQTFVIMCFIYLIKSGLSKVQVPIMSDVAEAV